jgi:enoyl-[acyl-carrier protein] reductase I
MSFLKLEEKKILIFGVFNKKSVGYSIAKILEEEGAKVILSVKDQETKDSLKRYFNEDDIFICNVDKKIEIEKLREKISDKYEKIDGIVHSLAYANYEEGFKPFHETKKENFLEAMGISCFSFIEISNIFKDIISKNGSCITISISTTKMASENYGYMAPIKAALDSSIVFLAKSFSSFSNIRFNGVGAGLLKTSASAGIPNYLNSYLYAEKATLRKENLKTKEVADLAVYLLSERSSGITAQTIIIDAGMSCNYFDKEIINKVTKLD